MTRRTAAEVQALAARMSSEADTVSWGAGGVRNREQRWQVARGRVARAIVANPDIASYFRFLLANRTTARLRELQDALNALFLSLEGLFLEHAEPPPDTRRLAAQAASSLTALRGGAAPGDAGIGRLLLESAGLLKKEAGRTRAGTRLQARSAEARRQYLAAAEAVADAWSALVRHLAAVRERHVGTPALVQRQALLVPVEHLRKTAAMGVVLDRETEYAGQLLAGLAAVQMAARPFEFGVRLRYDSARPAGDPPLGPVLATPLTVRPVTEDGQTVGVLLSVPADLLGITRNDFVAVNGEYRATVRAVDGPLVTFSGDVGEVATLAISSPLWAQTHVTLPELVEQFFLDHPTEVLSPRRIDLFAEFGGLPALVRRMPAVPGDLLQVGATVGTLYRMLFSVIPIEVERTFRRIYANFEPSSVEAHQPFEEVWRLATAAILGLESVRPGRALLDMLRAEGFDRAAELLVWGKLDEVLQMGAEHANYASHTTFIASGGTQ